MTYAVKLNAEVVTNAVEKVDRAVVEVVASAKLIHNSIEVSTNISPISPSITVSSPKNLTLFEKIFGQGWHQNDRIKNYKPEILNYFSEGGQGIIFELKFYLPRDVSLIHEDSIEINLADFQNKYAQINSISQIFGKAVGSQRIDPYFVLDNMRTDNLKFYDLKWNTPISFEPLGNRIAGPDEPFTVSWRGDETVATILKLNTGLRGVGVFNRTRLFIEPSKEILRNEMRGQKDSSAK